MLIGARQSLWRGGRLSAKSYVQDGLIAQWDGVENTGYGKHDPNALNWVDLVKGYASTGNAKLFTDNSARFDQNGFYEIPMEQVEYLRPFLEDRYTIEFTATPPDSTFVSPYGQNIAFRFGANFQMISSSRKIGLFDQLQFGTAGNGRFNFTFFGGGTVSFSINNTDSKSYYNGCYGETKDIPPRLPYGDYYYVGAGHNGVKGFCGFLHSIRIYNRALTHEEISKNYAIDKERFGL